MLAQAITAEESLSYLERPFNPPEADSDTFGDEWWSVRTAVASALTPFGTGDDYGRGDYCIGESRNLSRGISVVLTSTALLRPEVVSVLRDTLRQAPFAYSIHLTDDNFSFDVFIERDRVLVHPDDSTLLHSLQLDVPKSPNCA